MQRIKEDTGKNPNALCLNEFMVTGGRIKGRGGCRVWDGYGHTAVFNMENQQGPVGQHRQGTLVDIL